MEKRYGILLENGANYLTEDEFFELREKSKEQGMDLLATKNDGPKASFNDISIFISKNTTELIIAGLMMPVVYDTLKTVISFAIKKIKEKVKIVQSGKIRAAKPCIKFQMLNCEIIAPIPLDLSDEQFSIYFDSINEAVKTIQCNPATRYEHFIIERKEGEFKVEIKTIIQYAQEQWKKQQKSEAHNYDDEDN
ncbi:hypothetical protein AT727_08810 [Desulfitobacterium hafniense]|uniref:Uncharacterized protein n=1 Tax=Desulfitobacterium hafniense TaxID=49338 RepID=A0A0W1JF43_DESHA|nr:hypothetical protein [Desulfitobacterium hafniense]KTE90018.1 hypothetical protein AT727_08810 [Desulfitobacterium hafniense]